MILILFPIIPEKIYFSNYRVSFFICFPQYKKVLSVFLSKIWFISKSPQKPKNIPQSSKSKQEQQKNYSCQIQKYLLYS